MNETLLSIAKSWTIMESPVNSTEELLTWIQERNKAVAVEIRKTTMQPDGFWFYDRIEGRIRNRDHSFFSIAGFHWELPDGTALEQPILMQEEIGYLGILCKEIHGVMHFLMQAKIEPGNVNKIQISPTIQATKSNFTQRHGGARPAYLDYFLNASRYEIIVDQLQSEQSARFYKKRNRNILIRVEEDLPLLPSHRWMTLGQLKRLMREENLVNMDTRTVLSCIPFSKLRLSHSELLALSDLFSDKPLFCSVFAGDGENHLPEVYRCINDFKMFSAGRGRFLPLHELGDWQIENEEFVCRKPWPFKVTFCDITIEGREVKHWTQPLFEATGIATFGLFCCEDDGIMKFLVHAAPEFGCFDAIELGPTIQREAVPITQRQGNAVDRLFDLRLKSGEGLFFHQLLSEEGGRFYHEQNKNVLLRIKKKNLPPLPDGYFLLDHRTLNELVQVNNTLNIQLRNLLSLLEV